MFVIRRNYIEFSKTVVVFYYSTKYNEKYYKHLEKKCNSVAFVDIHDIKNRPEFQTFYLNFSSSYACHVYENGKYIRKLDLKNIEKYLDDMYYHKNIEKLYGLLCCHHKKPSKEHYKIYFSALPIITKKYDSSVSTDSSSSSSSMFSLL